VLMSLVVWRAEDVITFEPDYGQPWLQAQPPGFSHPAVLAEIRFDKGEAPIVPEGLPAPVAPIS